jgi:cytosine/creatinine deaminase
MTDHHYFMQEAIREAQKGSEQGGIPIGSVLVHQNQIIGRGHNQRIQKKSPTLHGEMDALENAGRLPAKIYQESTIYTTLSPCSMCTGAILLYKIPHVVIGENISFIGEEEHLKNHGVHITLMQDPQCIQMMKDFIEKYPHLWNEDIGV